MDFPSATANIPVSYLFDLFPVMQPRAFSIASSITVSSVGVWKYMLCMYSMPDVMGMND